MSEPKKKKAGENLEVANDQHLFFHIFLHLNNGKTKKKASEKKAGGSTARVKATPFSLGQQKTQTMIPSDYKRKQKNARERYPPGISQHTHPALYV